MKTSQRPDPAVGLVLIEECLDENGGIVLPPGETLISLIDRNIAAVGDAVAFRYLDYAGPDEGRAVELTWTQLGRRLRAIGARLQDLAVPGDRVAILAPQGLDYITGFYAAVKCGTVAVPLFAPELPGHAQRLDTALRDSAPAVVLTTAAVRHVVEEFLDKLSLQPQPHVLVIDEIPDSAGEDFEPVGIDVDDVSHLQYTSGTTRPPVGVQVTHRAVATNLLQMILSIDMLDRNTHGLSWLPLYHDMGLSMIGFPAVYGGHSTLMSPTAFIRRPQRWINALSDAARRGRVVTAAPNFAYELTAARGLPAPDADIDLANVVMIIGSEPVSMAAISAFNQAFSPYGLPPTAIKPSYGIAEATLFVATIAPDATASVQYLDREQLGAGRACPIPADAPGAVAHVSCGQVARSLSAVIVDAEVGAELPDGAVGEIWLQGDNVTAGYWGQPEQSRRAFDAHLRTPLERGSHTGPALADGAWLRTGDLGCYLDGELYVTGRIVDLMVFAGRGHYPQDIEATVAQASPLVRSGFVAAFAVPADGVDELVIVAERATGAGRKDPAPAIEAIRARVQLVHGVNVAEVRFVPAGAIPRTTSGKLARRACRQAYLAGALGAH
ncbi:fatty-acid--CoA ligase [Mycolicibacter minnesotensis]|uniref:Fatty-acid--CoA ligase n=1 Tax=Mycolicibacter minnesotensis TaxID=1118379 RepID=A0A7I7RBY0_9MYCO|nr:fatty acyl-AMP ligase [Mycolicibacter minnesotensis]ORB03167.1 fatty-acid--CoA ligase [Mycolicibacter minnesotensis]BBY35580.1 nitrate ABC transporter substrate-binding protein [Mycolicibacter minnesotensis]